MWMLEELWVRSKGKWIPSKETSILELKMGRRCSLNAPKDALNENILISQKIMKLTFISSLLPRKVNWVVDAWFHWLSMVAIVQSNSQTSLIDIPASSMQCLQAFLGNDWEEHSHAPQLTSMQPTTMTIKQLSTAMFIHLFLLKPSKMSSAHWVTKTSCFKRKSFCSWTWPQARSILMVW